jgi:hypothetical protein
LLLAIQAALTLGLIWSNTAFSDEALYLWAGRLELAHFLPGAPWPAFSTYFSGSPARYPPLAAIAAGVSGLAGARLLSMAMMLGATGMLSGITRRLFDRRSGFLAAGLFAGLAGAQFIGALATDDAMTSCLLGLGAWLAVVGIAGAAWVAGCQLGQANPELLCDRGEQLPGLAFVHGPDSLEQLRTGFGLLAAEAGQGVGRIRAAGRPQLVRGQADHRRHPGHGAGRAAHLRVDAGAHDLIAARDLTPAAFAQSGPTRGLPRGQSLPGQSCCDQSSPFCGLRAFGHGSNLRMNFARCPAHPAGSPATITPGRWVNRRQTGTEKTSRELLDPSRFFAVRWRSQSARHLLA